jgi:ABC-type nitrate/sulfonate/bicarbonate transport system substrate-binding protein
MAIKFSTKGVNMVGKKVLLMVLGLLMVLSVVTVTATPEREVSAVPSVEILCSPTGYVPLYVGNQEGLFEGINVVATNVGYAEETTLFIGGDSPIGSVDAVEAAKFVAQGENIVFMTTAGAISAFEGVFVRAADYPNKYGDATDLIGKKFGHTGWGDSTVQAYQALAKAYWDIDIRTDYDCIVADGGSLVAMLDKGQIEGFLNWSGLSIMALTSPKYEAVASFRDVAETSGEVLLQTGYCAREWWIESYPDTAVAFIEGLDKAVKWMAEHPEEFGRGGKYEKEADEAGWLTNDATEKKIQEWLRNYQYFNTSDIYTDSWIDATWEFIKLGQGIFIDELPNKDDLFWRPPK